MVIIIYERFFLVHFTFVFAYCTLYYLNLFTRFEIRINIINELKPEHTSNIYNYRYKSLRLVWNKKKKKKIAGKPTTFSDQKMCERPTLRLHDSFILHIIRQNGSFQRYMKRMEKRRKSF